MTAHNRNIFPGELHQARAWRRVSCGKNRATAGGEYFWYRSCKTSNHSIPRRLA